MLATWLIALNAAVPTSKSDDLLAILERSKVVHQRLDLDAADGLNRSDAGADASTELQSRRIDAAKAFDVRAGRAGRKLDLPELDMGSWSMAGAHAPAPIREALSRAAETVSRCYRSAAASDPELAGELVSTMIVATDGHVSEVKVVRSNVSPPLGDCIKETLGRLRFAPHTGGEPWVLTTPWTFRRE